MSKVLKIAAAVVGVVAIIAAPGLGLGIGAAITGALGVSASTLTLISAGLAIGSSLLAPKPRAPSASPAATDRLFASINLRAPRAIVFGHTAMATDIRDQEYTDNQAWLHRFVVVASHKVQAIEQLWFDDKLVWTADGGVQGDVVGYLTVTPVLEGSAANAINISSRMGSTRRFTGLAYLHLRYKLTGNAKNTDSPFAQSIPTRMTVIGKAALVYDPRLDSSVGGSGPQRANDQTSWAWNDDAARNPALQMLWYLLGWRIRNPVTGTWKLAVGKGIPPERIDIDSFIAAANLCDEQVARAAGGTEPRYRSDGIFTEGDDPSLVLDNLKAAMNADLDDLDGKIRITVLHNDLGSPQIGLTANDVLDSFKWTQTPPLTDSFNVIRGSYTDPSTTSLYQQVDYPEVRIASPDGIDRIQTVNLPMVQSASQAQRLVKQRLQRALYGGMFEAVFQATAWRYRKGDVVPFTFPALGWANKLFRVVAMTIQVDGTVPMTLREEHPDLYLWDASDAPAVQGAAPTTYNHLTNPMVVAVEGAQTAADVAQGTATEALDAVKDANGNVVPVRDQIAATMAVIDINAQAILAAALRDDDLARVLDARTLVEGQPAGTTFLDFRSEQVALNDVLASALQLLGAKTADGSGWNLDLASVRVGPVPLGGKFDGIDEVFGTFSTNLQELGANFAGVEARVTFLREAFVGAGGGSYAKAVLRADADGVFGAVALTANGEERLSKISLIADELEFIDPNRGNPTRPFSIVNGKVRATNFEADTITYGALVQRFSGTSEQILDPAGWYQRLPGGLIMQGGRYRAQINQEIALSIPFPRPFPNQVLSVGLVPFINSASIYRDLWLQLIGNASLNGFSCMTQAATGNSLSLDGFDWWAWGL